MPISNPDRVVNDSIKLGILADAIAADASLDPAALWAFLVTAYTIDGVTGELTAATLGANGTQTAKLLTSLSAPAVSETGKVYSASALLTWTTTMGFETTVFKGIAVSTTNVIGGAFALYQFDDDITLDAVGQELEFKVEIGFDGNELYVVARRLPVGE